MNLYKVKLKAGEDASSNRTYDVLAADITEAARKALKIHHDNGQNFDADPHRVVVISETVRDVR